ncbi:MAG TPA: DUF3943 domain-containing protein, partial [Usitatibacter sp.]|nr:DUF3943 domain-containing protein [Usitatibacter sp.]
MRTFLASACLLLATGPCIAGDDPPDPGKSYAIPAAEIAGFDFLVNQFDRHFLPCCDFESNIHTIRGNLRSSWVVDRDPFLVNQLGHPYQGSMYHGFARAS